MQNTQCIACSKTENGCSLITLQCRDVMFVSQPNIELEESTSVCPFRLFDLFYPTL